MHSVEVLVNEGGSSAFPPGGYIGDRAWRGAVILPAARFPNSIALSRAPQEIHPRCTRSFHLKSSSSWLHWPFMGSRMVRRPRLLTSSSTACPCTRLPRPLFPTSLQPSIASHTRFFTKISTVSAKGTRIQTRHRAEQESVKTEDIPPIDACLGELQSLLSEVAAPNDEAVVATLLRCQEIAFRLQSTQSQQSKSTGTPARSPARRLLELDEVPTAATSAREVRGEQLSHALYSFLKEPRVFLSPRVLQLYVQIQSTLRHPESFPEIFQLYANKPIPLRGTSPIRYKQIRPGRLASAVPPDAASQALNAAIESRILPLCLDVIQTTVCTPAYRRRKIIQKMWVPGAVLVFTPPAAWLLAQQFDAWQITLTSRYARTLAFTGFASYVGFTAILGYVALTTANDQMERVTWRDGLPLTTRWLREDERALMDRIALSWGFKDKHRWGEEEGPEWDALKELVSMRDMILDRVELMEGME